MVDRDRYPLLAEYLDGLTDGLDAYPECQSKGSLVVSSLEELSPAAAQGLPEPLVELLNEPPPAGVWVPAVHSDAIFFAVCDRKYPTEEAVLKWTYERTIKMADHPLYRTMLRVPGPRFLLRMAAKAHGLIQRGTDLSVETDERGADVTLSFPPRLHTGLNLIANVALWRGCLDIVGATNVQSKLAFRSETEARYRLDFD